MLPASVEVAALRFLLYLIAHTLSDEIPAPEPRPPPPSPRPGHRAHAPAGGGMLTLLSALPAPHPLTPLLLGLGLMPVVWMVLPATVRDLRAGFKLVATELGQRPWWRRPLPPQPSVLLAVAARYGLARALVLSAWVAVFCFLAGLAWR